MTNIDEKVLPSEAVIEVLSELIQNMVKCWEQSYRTALNTHEVSDKRSIDHWNIVSQKFKEKGAMYDLMIQKLTDKHGIDYNVMVKRFTKSEVEAATKNRDHLL